MSITFEDIAVALSNASPEQLVVLKQLVAPETKLTQMEAQCQSLLNDINAGAARARAIVQSTLTRVQAGDVSTEIPLIDELIVAFGGR